VKDICLDLDRPERMGLPELIYGEHKSVDQLRRILAAFRREGQGALVTRLQPGKAAELSGGEYDPLGRTFRVGPPFPPRPGLVGVVSAGTSDAPVVAETAVTLTYLGLRARCWNDLGISCLQRLLDRLPALIECDLLICVAGFEGALPSVVAGLFPGPVIGVPASVGYGVAAGGKAALGAMLASCAGGLLVTNIDNGCGAALAAARLLRRRVRDADSQD